MTRDEVIDLLTMCTAYDRRTVGNADVDAWQAAIGDLPARDAMTAVVAHYRESREWIMPADVHQRVRDMRRERLRSTPIPPPPPETLDDPAAYRKALRDSAEAIASGDDGRHLRSIGGAQ